MFGQNRQLGDAFPHDPRMARRERIPECPQGVGQPPGALSVSESAVARPPLLAEHKGDLHDFCQGERCRHEV